MRTMGLRCVHLILKGYIRTNIPDLGVINPVVESLHLQLLVHLRRRKLSLSSLSGLLTTEPGCPLSFEGFLGFFLA